MRQPPPKLNRGIRYLLDGINSLRDFVLRTRVIPIAGWTETESGLLPPPPAKSGGFEPQWKLYVRVDPDDGETWQFAIKRGYFWANDGSGDQFSRLQPTTVDGQAFDDPNLVWSDLDNQSSNNQIILRLTLQSDTNLGDTIEDTRTTGTFQSYPSWLWYVTTRVVVMGTYTEGYTVGGSTVEQDILIGEIDLTGGTPKISQYLEGSFTLSYPVINSSESQPFLQDYTDYTF